MEDPPQTHKLATIVALDVAGYSARTEANEAKTVAQIALLRPVIEGIAKSHGGRVFNTAGDGFMLEFASALSGVNAALELADECRPRVRVGVHVGEVSVQPNGDLLGHGVNVAARLMAKAEPGSTIISADVRRMIRGPLAERFASRGTVQLDKMAERIEIFAPAVGAAPTAAPPAKPKSAQAGAFQWQWPTPRLAAMIGLPVLLVIIGTLTWSLTDRSSPAGTNARVEPTAQPALVKAPDNAIAVLPFSNLTGKADDIAFAAGLHDDLLARLAKIGALQVIARTSVLGYTSTTKKISEIAKELGVAAVLEGSVQRAGSRVRITVQLIDPATDAQRWGETYDRTLTADNLFDMQREITEAIGKALNTVLTARELTAAFKGGTRNLQAYEHFAAGRLKLRSAERSRLNLHHEAIAAFDQAIALDPSFAAAHALKAYALGNLFWFGQSLDTKLRDRARAALDRAEALAPDATETQFALAEYFYHGFLDYKQAMIHAERALEASPNSADAWYIKAVIARRDGRFAVSNEAFARAIVLDPQNPVRMLESVEQLVATGEFARAEMLIARARAIDPTTQRLRSYAAWFRFNQGDAAGAWAEYKDVRSFFPASRLQYALATRDPANIRFALEDWPEAERRPAAAPELYEISRARALLALGQEGEARGVLLAIKARLEASPNPYPGAWRPAVGVTPADVPGMLGDLAGVKAAERDFLTNAPRDEFSKWGIYEALAVAFLRAGDPDRAMHYLEELEKHFGPAFYLRFSIDPEFEALRDHPKYKALKTRYEAWASAKAKGGAK